jgi:hypothetical protein
MAAMNTSIKYIPTSGSYTTSFGYSNTQPVTVNTEIGNPAIGGASIGNPIGKNVPDKKMRVFVKTYTALTRYFAFSHYSFPLHQMARETIDTATYKPIAERTAKLRPFMASAIRMDGTNANFTVIGDFTPVIGNIIEIYDCKCPGKPVQDRYEFAEIVKFEEI